MIRDPRRHRGDTDLADALERSIVASYGGMAKPVNEHERFEKMRQSNKELERLVASLPPMSDSTPLIREDRDQDC